MINVSNLFFDYILFVLVVVLFKWEEELGIFKIIVDVVDCMLV